MCRQTLPGASYLHGLWRCVLRWPNILVLSCGALLLALFAVPVIALLLRVTADMVALHLTQPPVLAAIRLSLGTTLMSTAAAVIFGTPLAYALDRRSFTGKRIVEALVHVPIVLPPAVAGVALLMAFGRRGLFGGVLQAMGLEIAFTTTAVVIAQTFVAAPFYVRAAQAGFSQVDPVLEGISATLGVGPSPTFWRITLPLALPAMATGAAMAWARSLGEFGATIMFAGNFPGRSQTMPLAVYGALQGDLDSALVLSAIMVLLSFVLLAALHALAGRYRAR